MRACSARAALIRHWFSTPVVLSAWGEIELCGQNSPGFGRRKSKKACFLWITSLVILVSPLGFVQMCHQLPRHLGTQASEPGRPLPRNHRRRWTICVVLNLANGVANFWCEMARIFGGSGGQKFGLQSGGYLAPRNSDVPSIPARLEGPHLRDPRGNYPPHEVSRRGAETRRVCCRLFVEGFCVFERANFWRHGCLSLLRVCDCVQSPSDLARIDHRLRHSSQ